MKCPYQTRITHKIECARGYGVGLAKDITEFGECLKNECPFYYTKVYTERIRIEHCRRAESEINE